jgi:dipeptidase E
MEIRILLGGGGSAEDERPIFELFASWVGTPGSVLYLPIASGGAYEAHFDWISSALNPLGVHHVEMWTTLTGRDPAEIDRYEAIFIGGGNTFSLLNQLRTAGFEKAIGRFASRGGVIYGGSAGAIVLGRDISTCSHLDENAVGLTNTLGLDLLGGDSVWCHYHLADDALIHSHVERTNSPTLALSETSGLWARRHQEHITLGSGIVYRFTAAGKHAVGDRPLGFSGNPKGLMPGRTAPAPGCSSPAPT